MFKIGISFLVNIFFLEWVYYYGNLIKFSWQISEYINLKKCLHERHRFLLIFLIYLLVYWLYFKNKKIIERNCHLSKQQMLTSCNRLTSLFPPIADCNYQFGNKWIGRSSVQTSRRNVFGWFHSIVFVVGMSTGLFALPSSSFRWNFGFRLSLISHTRISSGGKFVLIFKSKRVVAFGTVKALNFTL